MSNFVCNNCGKNTLDEEFSCMDYSELFHFLKKHKLCVNCASKILAVAIIEAIAK